MSLLLLLKGGGTPQSSSFTADAVLRKTQSASFTRDAVIQRQSGGEVFVLPDAVASLTNFTGTVADIDEHILGSPIDPDRDTSYIVSNAASTGSFRILFTPPQQIGPALQSLSVRHLRTGSSATVQYYLYEYGVQIRLLTSLAVPLSATDVTGLTFSRTELTDPTGAGVELFVNISVAGSGTVRITAAEWDAQLDQSFTANAILQRSMSSSFTGDAVISKSQTSSFTADAIISVPGLVFSCGATCGLLDSGADPGGVEEHEDHWEFSTALGVSISATAGPGSRPAFRYNPTAAQAETRRFLIEKVVAGGFRLRVDTLPGSTVAIAEISNPNGNGRIYLTAAGALQVEVGASAKTTFGTVSANAAWHWITFQWDATTGTATLKARLDGGTEQSQSNAQTSINSTDWHQGFQTSATADIYITDIVLSNKASHYPLTAQKVTGQWTASDGTHSFTTGAFKYDNSTNISPSATDVHTYLSDTGIEAGSDFISANTNATSSYVEVGFAASGFTSDPLGVTVVTGLHSAGLTTNAIKLVANDGGSLSNVTQPFVDGRQDVSATSIVTIERVFSVPPSGGTWTAAKVDALKVRYGYYDAVGSIPFWDAILLEVPFTDLTTSSFTADAVISRGQTGSFTADAVVQASVSSSFTANAVFSKTISETTEPIIFISRAAAGTNTVALPTFAIGDLAVVSAFRSGSNTPPTVPGTFTTIATSGANTCSQSVGYRVLQSGDTDIGTWTNASSVQVLVFRNQHATTPIGSSAADGASSNQMAYAALTLQDQTGRSWVLGVGGHRTATNVGSQTVSGTETTVRSGTSTTISAHTAEGVPSWSAHNFDSVVNASSGWRTYAIEIRAFADSGLSANAWIQAFPTSSLTANAVISVSQSASFTANAVTQASVSSSFTADAVIARGQTGSFTADAVLQRSISASFTGDAVLQKTITSSFTADAVISRSQSNTFTADAVLRKDQTGSLTANAVISKAQTASFTADAQIAVLILDDNFNRTVDPGWGTSSDGRARYAQIHSIGSPDAPLFHSEVDGSAGTLDPDPDIAYAFFVGWPVPYAGTVQFDFHVPADTTEYISHGIAIQRSLFLGVYARGDGDWTINFTAGGSVPELSFTPDADAWYTLKVNTGVGAPIYAKVWKVGDPEPDWMLAGVHDGIAGIGLPFIGIEGIARPFFDNLKIWTSVGEFQTAFPADAVISQGQSATFTADAFIPAQFRADAVIARGQEATFTADAFIAGDFTMGFGAYAVISAAQSATFTADAVIARGQTASFTADAIVQAAPTASLTANAVIASSVTQTFTADAVIQASRTQTFTADAVLLRGQTATFTSDAVIRKDQTATFSADAVITALVSSSFTANAVIQRSQSASLTADAVIAVSQSATFSADAILQASRTQTFTGDAVVQAVVSASFTADAIIARNFTADAIISRSITQTFTGDAWINPVFSADAVISVGQSTTFTADAFIFGAFVMAFSTDAVIQREQTASFTADAVISRAQTASITADAVVQASRSQTFSADAVVQASVTQTFAADAVLQASRSQTFTADAVLSKAQSASLTADSIFAASISASFTANAVIRASISQSLTADAVIQASRSQTFAADAVLSVGRSATFTADASINAFRTGSFTADAYIFVSGAVFFTADAVIQASRTASFTANAIASRQFSDTFTADALVAASTATAFTANAVIQSGRTAAFTANAVLQTSRQNGFAADAVLATPRTGSFTADAFISGVSTASFTANAVIQAARSQSFTGDAVLSVGRATSFTADAQISAATVTSFTADAVIIVTGALQFTADAVLRKAQASDFTADAWIAGAHLPSINSTLSAQGIASSLSASESIAAAISAVRIAAAFNADTILSTISGNVIAAHFDGGEKVETSFTADAVIAHYFTADAVIV